MMGRKVHLLRGIQDEGPEKQQQGKAAVRKVPSLLFNLEVLFEVDLGRLRQEYLVNYVYVSFLDLDSAPPS